MVTRPCSVCGTTRQVNPSSLADIICHRCRRNGHSTAGTYLTLPEYRTCKHCEAAFTVAKRSKRKYCDLCRERSVYQRQPMVDADYNRRMAKRAKSYGVDFEPIDRQQIYRRDKWRCGICKGKIDQRCRSPHPRSATIDHVIPMARGGPHTAANVHAAHWRCNVRKCAGGSGEQLALVG